MRGHKKLKTPTRKIPLSLKKNEIPYTLTLTKHCKLSEMSILFLGIESIDTFCSFGAIKYLVLVLVHL